MSLHHIYIWTRHPLLGLPTSSCSAARLVWTAGACRRSRTSTTHPAMPFPNENGKTCESRQKRSLRIHRVFRCRLAPPTARPRTSEVGSAGPVEADLPSDMQGRDVKRLDIIYIYISNDLHQLIYRRQLAADKQTLILCLDFDPET